MMIGDVPILIERGMVSWTSGMEIDADGSPRAYALPGSGLVGLDAIGNAGAPGDWWGLVCDAMGEPYIQSIHDPAPGFPVSGTALNDHTKAVRDPTRYVDASVVPYISMPPELRMAGVHLGDLVQVRFGITVVGAIVADIGPHRKIGEGSIALCQALGVDPFRGLPHHKLAGIDAGVEYRVYTGTARVPAWPVEDLEMALAAIASAPDGVAQ